METLPDGSPRVPARTEGYPYLLRSPLVSFLKLPQHHAYKASQKFEAPSPEVRSI